MAELWYSSTTFFVFAFLLFSGLLALVHPICGLDQELFFHPSHYQFIFFRHPELAEACKADSECVGKEFTHLKKCWGYEESCSYETRDRQDWPVCFEFDVRWAKSLEEQKRKYWDRSDFGFVREERKSIKNICSKTKTKHISTLKCSAFIRHCLAENVMFDLATINLYKVLISLVLMPFLHQA